MRMHVSKLAKRKLTEMAHLCPQSCRRNVPQIGAQENVYRQGHEVTHVDNKRRDESAILLSRDAFQIWQVTDLNFYVIATYVLTLPGIITLSEYVGDQKRLYVGTCYADLSTSDLALLANK